MMVSISTDDKTRRFVAKEAITKYEEAIKAIEDNENLSDEEKESQINHYNSDHLIEYKEAQAYLTGYSDGSGETTARLMADKMEFDSAQIVPKNLPHREPEPVVKEPIIDMDALMTELNTVITEAVASVIDKYKNNMSN